MIVDLPRKIADAEQHKCACVRFWVRKGRVKPVSFQFSSPKPVMSRCWQLGVELGVCDPRPMGFSESKIPATKWKLLTYLLNSWNRCQFLCEARYKSHHCLENRWSNLVHSSKYLYGFGQPRTKREMLCLFAFNLKANCFLVSRWHCQFVYHRNQLSRNVRKFGANMWHTFILKGESWWFTFSESLQCCMQWAYRFGQWRPQNRIHHFYGLVWKKQATNDKKITKPRYSLQAKSTQLM